jgi:hypothetical protein
MEFNCVLTYPNINLEKIYNFKVVQGDTIVWHIKIVGLNLTGYAIRGELYDLNMATRMVNSLGGPDSSAPEIVLNHADDEYSEFTATVESGLTYGMQPYAQIEFAIGPTTTDTGFATTIMQQSIVIGTKRIIWDTEAQAVNEDDGQFYGENPLF